MNMHMKILRDNFANEVVEDDENSMTLKIVNALLRIKIIVNNTPDM